MSAPVFLEGDAVTLHPVEEDDLEFVQRLMNDSDVWRPALDIDPTNCAQVREFFERVLSGTDGVHCLARDGDERLGIVSLTGSEYGPDETARARSMELAYYFAPEYHRQGYASDATGRMVQYAFEDRNLRRVEAAVGTFNDGSIALLESLGFEREGTLREATWYRGEYYDAHYFGLLRDEWDGR